MKKLFKILGVLLIILVLFAAGGFIYLQAAFPKVSAAPELTIEPTPERIERGKYLANSFAFCIDCHSTRDVSKFSMPVVPGTEGKGGDDYGEGKPSYCIPHFIITRSDAVLAGLQVASILSRCIRSKPYLITSLKASVV